MVISPYKTNFGVWPKDFVVLDKIWKGEEERRRHFEQMCSLRTFVKFGGHRLFWGGGVALPTRAHWGRCLGLEGPDKLRHFRPWEMVWFCFVILGWGRICCRERKWRGVVVPQKQVTPGQTWLQQERSLAANRKGWGGDPAESPGGGTGKGLMWVHGGGGSDRHLGLRD